VPPPTAAIDPRLRVLYLLAVAVGVFFLPGGWVAGALALHVALWFVVRLPPRRLLRQIVKLWGFAAFIVASYALVADDPRTDRWVPVDLGPLSFELNVGAALVGAIMVLRVLTVVLASQVARAGDPRAVAAGLRRLGAPAGVAAALDTVLALMGGGGGGGGGGRGDGSGRGRYRHADSGDGEPREGIVAGFKRVLRGDVEPIVRRLDRQIGRAGQHLDEHDALPTANRRTVQDVGTVAGVALTMLGIKALKILPAIPFAPGHKLVLLTPLYIVARLRTHGRAGATLTGLTMGTVAFLMGDGRYGIFEILKHVVPGVICDLVVPPLTRGGRQPGTLAWSLVGGLIAAGRFATIFLVTLAVQPPAVAFAFLVPGLAVHVTFGILSGYVSYHIVRALPPREADADDHQEAA
jgi:hypothetical protein